MHKYSKLQHKNEFIIVVIIIFIMSTVLINTLNATPILLGFSKSLKSFLESINLINILEKYGIVNLALTPMFIFWGLYYLFIKIMWKWKVFVYIFNVPNIGGRYSGTLNSNYMDPKTNKTKGPISLKLRVIQDFEKICFICEFPDTQSKSESRMATLVKYSNSEAEFEFAYFNQSYDINIENTYHHGYNRMTFNVASGTVNGYYFNDRGKHPNKGIITLKKDD
ncbi:hypothetical protein ACMGE6_10805 [Macrococcus equi]|uniref:Cap15 family cyclic dinucleotide receptor domain-containing protein n=1 Tax=Macrococcus equi TaxID=3395462 RepID=UPI0039BE27F6